VEKFKGNLALKIAPKTTAKILHLSRTSPAWKAVPVQDFVSLFVV